MSRSPDRPTRRLLGLGAVACAACCAIPLATALGGVGVLSLIGSFWMPAIALLAVAALAGMWVLRQRPRQPATPSTTADLGMPTRRATR